MNEDTEWIMDVYLQTDMQQQQVFDILAQAGLGAPHGHFTLRGEAIEISIRRNPDKSGASPFGISPIIIEVAKPASVSQSIFQHPLKTIFESLERSKISYETIGSNSS